MHYFITGCNGLVGSYIARKLLKEGNTLSALKRAGSSLKYIPDIKDDIKWYEGDILDVLSLEEPISKADFVIHVAGMVSFKVKDFPQMYKVNVEGTANVVNTCLKNNYKKLVYISSVAALGINAHQKVIDETQKWDDSGMNSKYGLTKFMGEEEVWRGHSEGLDVIILNPSVVLGKGEWGRSSLAMLSYVASNPLFYPVGTMNYIDARDLADMVYKLIDEKIYNERFIASTGSISYQEMFKLMAEQMGTRPPSYQLNNFIATLALYSARFISLFTGKPPKVSKELIKNAKRKTVFSNHKVNEKLNFSFRKLEDTLNWIIASVLLLFISENICYI